MIESAIHALIASEGYRLVEDAWGTDGRRTYVHDDDADRVFIIAFSRNLRSVGWLPDDTALRLFRNRATGELIEIEPGGSETSGHFLHHLKSDQ